MDRRSVEEWLEKTKESVDENGIAGVKKGMKPIYKKALHLTLPFSGGTSIFEREWDLLVILDACRYDLMEEVAPDYEFIQSISSFRSLESATKHWMERNFTDENSQEMKNTMYICGNPFSEEMLNPDAFYELVEVWRDGWDEELGTLPPRAVTDQAIDLLRTESPPRAILHYMQPHCPFVANGRAFSRKQVDRWGEQSTDIWHQLEEGHIDEKRVQKEYSDNLRYVLDDIELLLSNVDATHVVLTSDHGNALGEWGLYGHPAHMPFSCLRTVPWIETTARDEGTYTPEVRTNTSNELTTRERLESLGYV